MAREFFKTLREAEGFASTFNPAFTLTEVFSLDKPGTVRRFRIEQDDAIACEQYSAEAARAVVMIYR